jgi:hypothetical protein
MDTNLLTRGKQKFVSLNAVTGSQVFLMKTVTMETPEVTTDAIQNANKKAGSFVLHHHLLNVSWMLPLIHLSTTTLTKSKAKIEPSFRFHFTHRIFHLLT